MNLEKYTGIGKASKWIFLVLLIFLIYFPSLKVPFIFDDLRTIQDNHAVQMNSFDKDSILQATDNNRPVAMVSFALNYYFHKNTLTGFHLVNIVIHIINAFLLFFLLASILPQHKYPLITIMTASVVWAVHPVQTQTVTYIVQRMTGLATMFYLGAMLLYIKGRTSQQVRVRNMLWCGCLIAGLLGIGSKEIAVTLPFFIFLYEWYFFQNLKVNWFQKQLKFIAAAMTMIVITFVILYGSPLEYIAKTYQDFDFDFNLSQRLMTEFRVVIYYLTLLVFPHPARLNLDYDFTVSQGLLTPWTTIFSMLALILIFLFGLSCARKTKILSFAIVWFLGNLVLESSFIGLDLIFEHRLYLPSMLIIPVVFVLLSARIPAKAFISISLTIIIIFSCWTWQRNLVWQTSLSLWQDCTAKSKGNARPYINLGLALHQKGQPDKAIQTYQKAVNIAPNAYKAHTNLGVVLVEIGKIKEGIHHHRRALQINPNFENAHNNLGRALDKAGQPKAAMRHFSKAISLNNKMIEAYVNMGKVLQNQDRLEEAFQYYNKGLALAPNNAELNNNLGTALLMSGKNDAAAAAFSKAIAIKPDYEMAMGNMGVALMRQGYNDKAATYYKKALAINNCKENNYNLGMVLKKQGKFKSAIRHFSAALGMDANYKAPEQELKKVDFLLKQQGKIEALISKNPDNPILHYQMGIIFRKKYQFNKAVQQFEHALKLNSAMLKAMNQLAFIHAKDGKLVRAREFFQKMLSINPQMPNIYYNIACLYAREKKVDAALEWLAKAIGKGYSNWEAIKTDPDLENIHRTEEYEKLLRKYLPNQFINLKNRQTNT